MVQMTYLLGIAVNISETHSCKVSIPTENKTFYRFSWISGDGMLEIISQTFPKHLGPYFPYSSSNLSGHRSTCLYIKSYSILQIKQLNQPIIFYVIKVFNSIQFVWSPMGVCWRSYLNHFPNTWDHIFHTVPLIHLVIGQLVFISNHIQSYQLNN